MLGRSLALLLALTLIACVQTEQESDPEASALFVGLWVVDQPGHALYEATYYRFDANGQVAELTSVPDDCSGHLSKHCVTGSVASGDTSCVFGSNWIAPNESTLIINAVCSDDRNRDIVLSVELDDTRDASVDILTVGGESGWTHDNFPWRFHKCAPTSDETNCP